MPAGRPRRLPRIPFRHRGILHSTGPMAALRRSIPDVPCPRASALSSIPRRARLRDRDRTAPENSLRSVRNSTGPQGVRRRTAPTGALHSARPGVRRGSIRARPVPMTKDEGGRARLARVHPSSADAARERRQKAGTLFGMDDSIWT